MMNEVEREKFIAAMIRILGKSAVLHHYLDLLPYECDGYTLDKGLPAAVLFPADTQQVAAVVKYMAEHKIAYIPGERYRT